MKNILVLSIFMGCALFTKAQTTVGKNGSGQTGKTHTKQSARQLRGSGQYHGSRDTTPGSPMGTGGAGGNEMSGSQAGSASETALKSDKADVQSDSQSTSQGTKAKKRYRTKKKSVTHKNRRM